jgi:uncharacterized oligopeptide transporter (OPT) family protein
MKTSVTSTNVAETTKPEAHRADVALAEYAALRAEMHGRQSSQTTLVGICLTGIGLIIGLILSERSIPSQLVLVIPLIASGLGMFYGSHSRGCLVIGRYIREVLWPSIQPVVGGPKMPSWEQYVHDLRQANVSRMRYLSFEFLAGGIVFVLPSAGALAFYAPKAIGESHALWPVWLLGVVLLVLHVALTIGLARDFARRPSPESRP